MESRTELVANLFNVVDHVIDESPVVARSALLQIRAIAPESGRAERLLRVMESDEVPEDPLRLVMEAAEGLACRGLYVQARDVVAYVQRRYGSNPEARAWLANVDLLVQ